MKARRSILLLCIAAVVLSAVLIWLTPRPTHKAPSVVAETNAESSTAIKQAVPKANGQHASVAQTNVLSVQPAPVSSTPPPASETKSERIKEGLAHLNDEDIVLYGKVVDQFGAPVSDAAVTGSIQINNGVRVGSDRVSTATDGNGLFNITGYKGRALGINISKSGCALATTNTRFIYSFLWPEAERYVPDPNSPTVFKMWKFQGTESLLQINQHYKAPYTTAPICFDLLAGQIVPNGGDIKITVNRAPGIISGRNRLDWSLQVAAVEGGLMDSGGQERVTYAAPESGYEPSVNFIFSTNAPYKWFGGFTQGLFLMSRNGRVYSKVGLSFDINDAPDGFMSITFGGVANTNGSRNWEADPNTMKQ
jgi:hypothetical protein